MKGRFIAAQVGGSTVTKIVVADKKEISDKLNKAVSDLYADGARYIQVTDISKKENKK